LRDLPALRRIRPFTLVHRTRVAGAMLALFLAPATVFGLGQGRTGSLMTGSRAVTRGDIRPRLFFFLPALSSGSTICRFYVVCWIGERVVADIAHAVFDQVIRAEPGLFRGLPRRCSSSSTRWSSWNSRHLGFPASERR
jgi:ATP-binding cassette, subfamily B, bacterial